MMASIDLTTSRANQLGLRERLFGQRAHRPFDRLLRLVGLRLELLLQQRIEVADFECAPIAGVSCCWALGSAMMFSALRHAAIRTSRPAGSSSTASVCSSAGSCSSLATRSSAPLLPSM